MTPQLIMTLSFHFPSFSFEVRKLKATKKQTLLVARSVFIALYDKTILQKLLSLLRIYR